jgi:hypothetical protein
MGGGAHRKAREVVAFQLKSDDAAWLRGSRAVDEIDGEVGKQ